MDASSQGKGAQAEEIPPPKVEEVAETAVVVLAAPVQATPSPVDIDKTVITSSNRMQKDVKCGTSAELREKKNIKTQASPRQEVSLSKICLSNNISNIVRWP